MAVRGGDWFSAPCYRGQQPRGPLISPHPLSDTQTLSAAQYPENRPIKYHLCLSRGHNKCLISVAWRWLRGTQGAEEREKHSWLSLLRADGGTRKAAHKNHRSWDDSEKIKGRWMCSVCTSGDQTSQIQRIAAATVVWKGCLKVWLQIF